MNSVLSIIAYRMPVPSAGSAVHLLILAGTLAAVMLEIRLIPKLHYRKAAVLPAAGLVLLITEIIKQIFLTRVRGWSYSWSDFPFQLCSVPMYLMLVYPLLKGKWLRNAEGFLMTFGLIGGSAALLVPVSVFSDYVLLTLHSLLWHMILVFTGTFLFIDRMKDKDATVDKAPPAAKNTHPAAKKAAVEKALQGQITCLREYTGIGNLYLIFAAAAVLINSAFCKISKGTANMFFLGPSRPDMLILDDIYSSCGWITETLIFIAVTWCAGLVVFAVLRSIYITISSK